MINQLEQYLTMIRDMKAQNSRSKEFFYTSAEDFVLKNGKAMEWKPLPKGVKKGRMKECFKNAYELAQANPDLTYVEGYGLSMIPTEHAWCVDKDGNVVDNTWTFGGEPPLYFRVEMPLELVERVIWENKYYGVLWGEIHTYLPLMREPWEVMKEKLKLS